MNPYESEGNSYGGESNDFNTTLTLAKRAKEKGMREKIGGSYTDFTQLAELLKLTDIQTLQMVGRFGWKMELIPCLPG